MALSSTIEYCETQDVFDVYPQIDKYNMKRQINSRWILSGGDYYVRNVGFVGRLFKNGEDLGPQEEDAGQVNSPDEWFYNFNFDELILNQDRFQGGTDPNLDIIEIGDVWEDIIERIKRKASRIVEAKLGKSITREILKDREGNYPTSIVHITALKTAILLIMAHDPTSSDLIPLRAEYDDIIARILSGKIVMTGHRSENDSRGTMRYVDDYSDYVLPRYNVYPVELKGSYRGNEYELLTLNFLGYVRDGHALHNDLIYWVKGKSSTKLADTTLIDETLINFDYQDLGVGDLKVRFSQLAIPRQSGGEYHEAMGDGSEFLGGVLTVPIVYEIELWGSAIKPTISQVKPTTLSRSALWHQPLQ